MKKIILLVLIIAVGCKNQTKEPPKTQPEAKIEEAAKELEIVMNYKSNKPAEFKLVMNNIQVDEIQKKNIQIIEQVEPSTSTEELRAKFGPNNFSSRIYFNFGNKETKTVEITYIRFQYGENVLEVGGSDIPQYFSLNKYTVFDSINNVIKTKRVDGAHNPHIILKKRYANTLDN